MEKKYLIAAFYKFVSFPDYVSRQTEILKLCIEKNIKGTLLVAEEGINGTIAGRKTNIYKFLQFLKTDSRFSDIEHKESCADKIPFHRMKVKIKKEIVTLGQSNINPDERSGVRVDPKDWNSLITDPNTVIVDTRNEYE